MYFKVLTAKTGNCSILENISRNKQGKVYGKVYGKVRVLNVHIQSKLL